MGRVEICGRRSAEAIRSASAETVSTRLVSMATLECRRHLQLSMVAMIVIITGCRTWCWYAGQTTSKHTELGSGIGYQNPRRSRLAWEHSAIGFGSEPGRDLTPGLTPTSCSVSLEQPGRFSGASTESFRGCLNEVASILCLYQASTLDQRRSCTFSMMAPATGPIGFWTRSKCVEHRTMRSRQRTSSSIVG